MNPTPALARAQLAETLRATMERMEPGARDYAATVTNLLSDKHLVAAAMGASFMVPVKVLEG